MMAKKDIEIHSTLPIKTPFNIRA